MKAQLAILGLLMTLVSNVAFADVVLLKKGSQPGREDAVLVARYDQQIDQLNQTSNDISAQIFSRKSGLQNAQGQSRDGMTVTLVKIKSR